MVALSAFFSCRKSDVIVARKSTISPVFKSRTLSLNENLIADWPLANNANDLTGNGHNGTMFNVGGNLDRFDNYAASKFNGTTSYITVPDNPALRLSGTDFTLNAWIKMHSFNSSYGSSILSKHTSGVNNGWT
ncbi:MAG: hypothetical protein JST19_21390 [Bacteroidetes bacterium]|nr:hypothetical protein [Bacteroidota bacterium]